MSARSALDVGNIMSGVTVAQSSRSMSRGSTPACASAACAAGRARSVRACSGALSKERSSLHRERQRRPTGQFPVDARLGLPAANRPAHPFELTAQLEHVARLDEALESAVVDAREEGQPAAVLVLAQHRDGAGLCKGFDDQYARHHRPVGEVALEVPLVLAHGLPRNGSVTRSKLEYLVDQEEGLAVREDLLDRLAAERRRDSHATSRSLPRNRLRPRWA